jgi:peptide/nickel transport system substrate-binding protein
MKQINQLARKGFIAVLLLSAFVLAACAVPVATTSEESATPAATEIRTRLIVGVPYLDEILDAQQAYNAGAAAGAQIGQPLLRIDSQTGEVLPDLAESWSFSEDGMTMTFVLPAGAVYANGDPLDAQAVGDALFRNKEISPYASDFEALIDFNVVDATTLELIFSDPPAAFLVVLNSVFGGPWNASAAAEVGNEAFAVAPVASGPLLVQEFMPDSELLLVRNENYRTNMPFVENKGPLYLEEVLVRAIPEDVTLAGELEAGTVDLIVPAPVSAIDRLRNNPDITVVETQMPGFTALSLNHSHPYFSDLNVRKAIAVAIDRDGLVRVIGGANPAYTFVTPGTVAYSADAESYGQDLYAYDVAAAQALLAEAGWVDGDGDGIVEKDGESFSVELLTPAGNVAQEQVSQILQSQLREIGIDVQINQQDAASIFDTQSAGEYDMGFTGAGWGDPDILSLVFGAPWWNHPQYDNPALMEEMVAARTILDINERTAAYVDIQRTLLDDVVAIPLWQSVRYVAFRNNVVGVVVNGYPIFLNDVKVME